ncbi:MAG: type III-B CRISPR-associated protein Cas10/Cmr2 [Symploca sp. SIO2E9]|nr:type III-B CRISPR-associated protein Cas10/Cmr2 [Symploca sp. SIO2E9]
MNLEQRKLYALIHEQHQNQQNNHIFKELYCCRENLDELNKWWEQLEEQVLINKSTSDDQVEEGRGQEAGGRRALEALPKAIASSSDRVNLVETSNISNTFCQVKHPISGQSQQIESFHQQETPDITQIAQETDAKKVFWWFWRFYPEIRAKQDSHALLIPAHKILPDCPLHSYKSTVSALVGALYPETWQPGESHQHPYLLLFTFSPVQEFIKASRKFLDFWAGSYLLHYLSVKLCWHIAQLYGPDAVITPSLWSQEIIDALMVKEFDQTADNSTVFRDSFQKYALDKLDPVSRFHHKKSTSLSTAGFPNIITAIVPGQKAAEELGKKLTDKLTEEWREIADKVREDIKQKVISWLGESKHQQQRNKILQEFPDADYQACLRDLEKWQQPGCWEWNKLWEAQIENTWEPYWSAVPLGHPEEKLVIDDKDSQGYFNNEWKQAQEAVASSHSEQRIPTPAEEKTYQTLNVGTWWGSLQSRLGKSIQAVKNTRRWQIPVAPGERSTLSGQYSAVHPNLHYEKFREGAGVPAGSMRLFWRLIAEVYPGLFNGSEKLNALELTKRMAWQYGGVAQSLGIELTNLAEAENGQSSEVSSESEEAEDDYQTEETDKIDYEKFIRFPNLSSIAAARFAHNHPQIMRQYWRNLRTLIHQNLPDCESKFCSRTRARPFQVPQTDNRINPKNRKGQNFNGVMFSSKWLADDMGLNQSQDASGRETTQINELRRLVETAHKQTGFGDGSPADWWVIVLADGDGMGKYVSGTKLENYQKYIIESAVEKSRINEKEWQEFLKTKKRMGPATHVGLNRALLDFSNRLVPYLTEKRFCGKVVYSGGDDVMAVLPLEDLPEYLRSLRAAWCGTKDPQQEFNSNGGYWNPIKQLEGLPNRPHFTMGKGATMSMGIVIAHKSVPLPTVLENLWSAEKERAKKLPGTKKNANPSIGAKDGLCFRVIYGGGNILEALMKGHLLESWWNFIQQYQKNDLSPLLYRLAEELPKHACVTESDRLLSKATAVILNRREQNLSEQFQNALLEWLNQWEYWAFHARQAAEENALGTQEKDLAMLLKFSAFWVDKMVQRQKWVEEKK